MFDSDTYSGLEGESVIVAVRIESDIALDRNFEVVLSVSPGNGKSLAHC